MFPSGDLRVWTSVTSPAGCVAVQAAKRAIEEIAESILFIYSVIY
jgi:hypothetical protein